MRYVVLGGGGSFGLAVSRFLLEQEGTERVVGIGRNPPKLPCFTLGTGDNDPRYSYHTYHVTYELDLLMGLLWKECPDVIINFAAQGEGATSFNYSWRYFETNCVGLVKLVEELRKWMIHSTRPLVPIFIHIGTSELYGGTKLPAGEDACIRPTSPYAASKAAFDLYLLSLFAKTGFPMNIIRPSNCYGPGQQLHRLIPKAILCGLTGSKLPLHGGGLAEKSYMHTNDLASAIWVVLQKGKPGEVYNAGPEYPISIAGVVKEVAMALAMDFYDLCQPVGDRQHQDSRYWLDSSKLRSLGWSPKVGWGEGLVNMVNWMGKWLPDLRKLPTDFVMRG